MTKDMTAAAPRVRKLGRRQEYQRVRSQPLHIKPQSTKRQYASQPPGKQDGPQTRAPQRKLVFAPLLPYQFKEEKKNGFMFFNIQHEMFTS